MKPFGWYRTLIRNPRYRWLVILASLIYLVSPIDVSPDIIPFLGQIDDVIIITLLFSEVFQQLLGGSSPLNAQEESDRHETARRSYAHPENDVQTVDVKAVSLDDSNPG